MISAVLGLTRKTRREERGTLDPVSICTKLLRYTAGGSANALSGKFIVNTNTCKWKMNHNCFFCFLFDNLYLRPFAFRPTAGKKTPRARATTGKRLGTRRFPLVIIVNCSIPWRHRQSFHARDHHGFSGLLKSELVKGYLTRQNFTLHFWKGYVSQLFCFKVRKRNFELFLVNRGFL